MQVMHGLLATIVTTTLWPSLVQFWYVANKPVEINQNNKKQTHITICCDYYYSHVVADDIHFITINFIEKF